MRHLHIFLLLSTVIYGFYVPFEKRPQMPWKCRIRPGLCPTTLPPVTTNAQGLVIHEYDPLPEDLPAQGNIIQKLHKWRKFLCSKYSIGCTRENGMNSENKLKTENFSRK